MNFLAYDSPFMTGYRKLVDYMLLGLLWILACMPVITFGAATTAMLLTAEKTLKKDEGKIFVTFWKYFKQEFKEATILWVIQLPVLAILVANVWLLILFQLSAMWDILIIFINLVVFCWVQLWFAYLSKFEDNAKTILSNTFRMTMGNFVRTVLMSLSIVAAVTTAVVTILLIPPVSLLVPGTFIMIYTALMRGLFVKYIPKEESVLTEKTE